MKILIVGPGIIPIPTNGWGAVETVIWNQKIYLEPLGHTVDILNRRGLFYALKATPWRYDMVHLHYDNLSGFWVKLSVCLKFKLIITTHYGYAAFPERWDIHYKTIFGKLMKSSRLIVLNEGISDVFIKNGFKGIIKVLPNGTETARFLFKKTAPLKKAICLGKIEIRKRQVEIIKKILEKKNIRCDFVGKITNFRFAVDFEYTNYLGEWNRQEVYGNLTNYSCLILFSHGEAHPLVVLEAMAAGLSLVISKEASANLDKELPWIYICNSADEVVRHAETAIKENHLYRQQIREYAEEHFDWSVIARKYTATLGKLLI